MLQEYTSSDHLVSAVFDDVACTRSIELDGVTAAIDEQGRCESNTWDGVLRVPNHSKPVVHFPLTDLIKQRVRRVTGNFHDHIMEQLHFSKLGAASLFFDGVLTVADFRRAKVYKEYFEISDVLIQGRMVTVRILRSVRPINYVHAADGNGKLI